MASEPESLSKTLQDLHDRFAAASSDAEDLVSRLNTCLGLVPAGEQGVALEILFENLYEFGISLSAKEAAHLMHAAARSDVSSTTLNLVEVHDAVVSIGEFASQVERRPASWEAASLRWKFTLGQPTDMPSAWLDLTSDRGDGQLTFRSSGEVDLMWGTAPDWEAHEEHREVTTELGIEMCLDDLERAIQRRPTMRRHSGTGEQTDVGGNLG